MEVISLYEMEVPPIKILSFMKNNIYDHYKEQSYKNIDKTYTLQRKFLISLIQKISRKMGFKSQTFFMAVNYLDIIFSKNNDILFNYSLLAVGCLIIAFKYCENVPLRPIFKYFVNLYNNEVKDENYKIINEDLFKYEVIICKILDYKLNFFTIYDFNFFFFGNGIIKMAQLKEINNDISLMTPDIDNSSSNINSSSEIKKILIKIYERSRHYLDIIIENLICLKYDSLLISICIMEKSIDYVLINEFIERNGDEFTDIDIEEIKFNNQHYFKQIMKDFYKIDFELLPEYQNLKIECENYKLFENIYDKNSINLNENINSNQMSNFKSNIIREKEHFSKNKSIIMEGITKNSPMMNSNRTKEKVNFVYKKINKPVLCQNSNYSKYNISNLKKNISPKKRIERAGNSRENIFKSTQKEKLNKNGKITNLKNITTSNNFSQKSPDNYRVCTSTNKKNNYMKKCNASSSPSKKISKFNSSASKSIINKIKSKKIIDAYEEINSKDSNSNSIDDKRSNLKDNKNKKIKIRINKLAKPYIKKVIQNYEKIQDIGKKNININININNKILYGREIEPKDRNKSSKKIMVSKCLNQSIISSIRGKSKASKSRIENYEPKINNKNIDSSLNYETKNSNYNFIPFKFKKKESSSNLIDINQFNNSNSFILPNLKNNKNDLDDNLKKNKLYKSNFNVYNSNFSSRNSFQYPKHCQKCPDSVVNLKFAFLNKDKKDKDISISKEINNFTSLNCLKKKKKFINKRNNEDLNRENNTMNDSNYFEAYKNQNYEIYNNQNNYNHSININLENINENEGNGDIIKINNISNDRRHKSFSNFTNLHDYSTGISNEKNFY